MNVEFVEAPLFTQFLPETDGDYAELQLFLARNPEAGDVIPARVASAKRRVQRRR